MERIGHGYSTNSSKNDSAITRKAAAFPFYVTKDVHKFLTITCLFVFVYYSLYGEHVCYTNNFISTISLSSTSNSYDMFDKNHIIGTKLYDKEETVFSKHINASYFTLASEESFHSIIETERLKQPGNSTTNKKFDIFTWMNRTDGGLKERDRVLLGEIYSKAHSIFEYGLGESTYIANAVGGERIRYAGIDSDVVWVDQTRRKVSPNFRFYYGDIGDTKLWGYPTNERLRKITYQYQIAPLVAEQQPFDVYMVDGRYRVACVLISFLHASSAAGKISPSENYNTMMQNTIVLLHDCYQEGYSPKNTPPYKKRAKYKILDSVLDLYDHSRGFLCVYKRKTNVTDRDLYELWQKHRNSFA